MRLVTTAVILLVCFSNVVLSQRPSFGKCPTLGNDVTIDLDRMKGRWYEVERSFYIYELNRRCINMDMTPEGHGIRITTKAVMRTSDSSVSESAIATPKAPGSAQFRLVVDTNLSRRLPSGLRRALPGSGNYVILKTDYDNYAIVYSCSNIVNILHADLVWVLARTNELPVTTRLEIYNALERVGLASDRLTLTSHKDCPNEHK